MNAESIQESRQREAEVEKDALEELAVIDLSQA